MRSSVEAIWMRAWQQRGWLARLLWPLSCLFQMLIAFRFGLFVLGYKPQTRMDVPVVVVGNIFVGGTGKTPLVIWLVQQLQRAGWKPGVISRGYGASADSVMVLQADAVADIVGDEPLLIAQRTGCPVAVGRDRVAVARCLLAQHSDIDVLIADDGLQHYYLARDVEIMLFDQRGIGNGWVLPAGPLREPARRRRDFTVLNAPWTAIPPPLPGVTGDLVRMQLLAQHLVKLSDPAQRQELTELRGAQICAAAGIGNPQRFYDMLSAEGLQFSTLSLSDHHHFSAQTFAQVQADYILITEKDAVKCRQIPALKNDARIWVVPVDAHIDQQFATDLIQMISEKKHGRTPA